VVIKDRAYIREETRHTKAKAIIDIKTTKDRFRDGDIE